MLASLLFRRLFVTCALLPLVACGKAGSCVQARTSPQDEKLLTREMCRAFWASNVLTFYKLRSMHFNILVLNIVVALCLHRYQQEAWRANCKMQEPARSYLKSLAFCCDVNLVEKAVSRGAASNCELEKDKRLVLAPLRQHQKGHFNSHWQCIL